MALAALTAAVVSPIDGLGEDYLFSMHMLQHILLGDIAPVFLLLALSRVIMRPATRRLVAVERALGRFAHPLTGLFLWFGADLPLAHPGAVRRRDRVARSCTRSSTRRSSPPGSRSGGRSIQPVPMRRRMTGLWPFAYIGAAKAGSPGSAST